jgi:hypothetical protein
MDDNWELAGNIPYQFLERGSSDVPYIMFAWYHQSDGRPDKQVLIGMLSVLAEEGSCKLLLNFKLAMTDTLTCIIRGSS